MKHLAAAAAQCTSSIDARREDKGKKKKKQTGRDFTTHFLPPTAAHHIRGRSRGHNKNFSRGVIYSSPSELRGKLCRCLLRLEISFHASPCLPTTLKLEWVKGRKKIGRGWGLLHRDCNISNYESCKTKGWGLSLWCLISCRQAFEEEQQMNPQFL